MLLHVKIKSLLSTTLPVFLVIATQSLSEDSKETDVFDNMFCEYTRVFAEQISRNHIRGVPFSRLSEFFYFPVQESMFLEDIATEIYALSRSVTQDELPKIGEKMYERCHDDFF